MNPLLLEIESIHKLLRTPYSYRDIPLVSAKQTPQKSKIHISIETPYHAHGQN